MAMRNSHQKFRNTGMSSVHVTESVRASRALDGSDGAIPRALEQEVENAR